MTNKTEYAEKAEYNEVFELLAKAKEQYQTYLNICNTTNSSLSDGQISAPQYTWDHPLTLVMNKGR